MGRNTMSVLRSVIFVFLLIMGLTFSDKSILAQENQQPVVPVQEEEEDGKPLNEVIGYRDDLFGVDCSWRDYIWVVGYWGAIFHSKTAGETWHRQESGTDEGLFGVSFVRPLSLFWVLVQDPTKLNVEAGRKILPVFLQFLSV